jgi:hypothetical protein
VAGQASVTASWTSLTAGTRYLGPIPISLWSYDLTPTATGSTILRVDSGRERGPRHQAWGHQLLRLVQTHAGRIGKHDLALTGGDIAPCDLLGRGDHEHLARVLEDRRRDRS